MIKMYKVTVENKNPEENPKVYIVREDEKNALICTFSDYRCVVEEFLSEENE